MFRKKGNDAQNPENEARQSSTKPNWFKISLIINIVFVGLVVIFTASGYLLHQSNSNPEFCASCHIMQNNVQSYLTSTNLDHVHDLANVQCKDCHDYTIPAEVKSGFNYITGNYEIVSLENPNLPKREYDDDMCLQCHISMEHVAAQTDFLEKNPHASHWTDLQCSDCHISHGEQIDYCSQCHDNGGQRLIGDEITPRAGTTAQN